MGVSINEYSVSLNVGDLLGYHMGTRGQVNILQVSTRDSSFRIEGLPSGNYIVRGTMSGYVSKYYDDVTDREFSTQVVVNGLDDTSGIIFLLS